MKPSGPIRYLAGAVLTLLISAALWNCAAIGTPDGGPYDEEPPRITGSNPSLEATGVKSRKITIDFNEFIKLENAVEKVIVSPPQIEQPEIKVTGKKIQVELFDSLKPQTTYSIDFADGIKDNNEGNPLGDFCFRFSTGSSIDSLEVSGYVLDAQNLTPVKGITVGLHSDLSDSAFTTKPFERVSRTDESGHFTVRGIAEGRYRIYAVMDMDGTFGYSSPSEQIAWSDSIIVPYAETAYRTDSIWNDDKTLDTVLTIPYTAFYPNDIHLLAFTARQTEQYIKTYSRSSHEKIDVSFALPMDSLPGVECIGSDWSQSYILQYTASYDSLTFWLTDTLVYYQDTLALAFTYPTIGTDGKDSIACDTLQFIPKKSRKSIVAAQEKARKEKQEEKEKQLRKLQKDNDSIGIAKLLAPAPEKLLAVKFTSGNDISPYDPIGFSFEEPVTLLSDTAVHVYRMKDSIEVPIPFELEQDSIDILKYHVWGEWKPEEKYLMRIDSASFQGIWGLHNGKEENNFSFAPLSKFSTMTVHVSNPKPEYLVGLYESGQLSGMEHVDSEGSADFYFLTPGKFNVTLLDDRNGNGVWDTGDYLSKTQPEGVYFINKEFTLKADWYHETEWWNIDEVPLSKQRPASMSKGKEQQKPRVDTHKKNVERLEKKASQINAEKKKKERQKQRAAERRERFQEIFRKQDSASTPQEN
ncbi:MAG: Ig-like domain-containing protein [Bacteroidaceae bacterium]|nr:Ig-like domain-containing protein [Bacteroidaceae bacterium]